MIPMHDQLGRCINSCYIVHMYTKINDSIVIIITLISRVNSQTETIGCF